MNTEDIDRAFLVSAIKHAAEFQRTRPISRDRDAATRLGWHCAPTSAMAHSFNPMGSLRRVLCDDGSPGAYLRAQYLQMFAAGFRAVHGRTIMQMSRDAISSDALAERMLMVAHRLEIADRVECPHCGGTGYMAVKREDV